MNNHLFRRNSSVILGVSSIILAMFLIISEERNINSKNLPTWQLRRLFTAQAESIVNGRLNVQPNDIPGECFEHAGKCFGYFGITPSLFRIPFLPFIHGEGLSAISNFLAIALTIAGSLMLLNKFWAQFVEPTFRNGRNKSHIFRTTDRYLYLAACFSLSFGNLIFQITRPTGYEEAISWATCLTIWSFMYLFEWFSTAVLKNLMYVLILITLAANSRPTAAVTSLGIAVTILIIQLNSASRNRGTILIAVCIALIPLISMVAIFYLKLGQAIPSLSQHAGVPETSYWKQIYDLNGGVDSGWRFVLTNSWAYLRPDSISIIDNFRIYPTRPFIKPFSYLWPLRPGSMHVEAVSSLTALVPGTFVMMLLAPLKLRKLKDTDNFSKLLVLAIFVSITSFSSSVINLIAVGISNRYLVDFAPGIILTTCSLSALFAAESSTDKNIDWPKPLLIVFLLFGTVVNIWLALSLFDIRMHQ